jgi:preprotein translocase subunit SecE
MSWTTQVREFIKEVRVESGKISWPTRTELRDSTIVVIVTVLLISAFVGVVDRILAYGVALLFRG